MDPSDTLFLIHISDGYTFRNTLNIVRLETDHVSMLLSPDNIEISFINTSKCAIHKILINTDELTMYRYNIRDESGGLLSEYCLSFDAAELFNTTKGIGRKDGIRLYWLHGDNKINVQPLKLTVKDPGRSGSLFVNITQEEYVRYNVATVYNSIPNVRVQAKDFSDICGQTCALKCSKLDIVGGYNSVIFRAVFHNNNIASIHKFTSQKAVINKPVLNVALPTGLTSDKSLSLNVINPEDLMSVSLPLSTLKALSKIHNIAPMGTMLRFYFSESKPAKLESPIGTYGLYTIHIR